MVREFTKKEILKVEEMAQTKTSAEIARYFGVDVTAFKYIKKKQPELKEAICRGNAIGGKRPRTRTVKKRKTHEFTRDELIKIEELSVKGSYREVAENLGLAEHRFLALRKTNRQVREAVERGVARRGDKFIKSQRDKRSENIKNGKVAAGYVKAPSLEYDKMAALQRFREEYEENKRKRLQKEAKDLDLI